MCWSTTVSPKPTFEFDEEQEFFVDLQGLEMYHTDVVEALNSLHEVALLVDDMIEPGQIWSVNPSKLKRVRDAIEALPKGLL